MTLLGWASVGSALVNTLEGADDRFAGITIEIRIHIIDRACIPVPAMRERKVFVVSKVAIAISAITARTRARGNSVAIIGAPLPEEAAAGTSMLADVMANPNSFGSRRARG
jgi:hypothetical protein